MKRIADFYKKTGTLHHAYIFAGESESVRQALFAFLEKDLSHPTRGNPDFFHELFDIFSIDDARRVKEMQSVRPLAGARKVFVIETRGMAPEAQNALLKVLEEPASDTHFFIITNSAEIFLPTIRSRAVIFSFKNKTEGSNKKISETAKIFLDSLSAERIELVQEIVENKDRGKAIDLIDDVIIGLAEGKYSRKTISQALKCRSYLNDRSSSVKIILEHLAVVLK